MKKGVLLVNLGTPEDLTSQAITSYLTEFLLDRNVVDLPRFFWKPLLTKVIIPKRLPIILEHYRLIWDTQTQSAPLLSYSRSLVQKLAQSKIAKENIEFDLAMTYGKPDLKTQLLFLLKEKKCDEIIIVPLYPQYSTTTVLPILMQIEQVIAEQKLNSKQIKIIEPYYKHTLYIQALCDEVTAHFKTHSQPDVLLLSYHGIPLRYIKKRQEPYVEHCEETTRLIQAQLRTLYPDLKIEMSYQSRFGKGKWTSPNTSDKLINYAKQNQSVAIMCPGFAVDCLETLYEIDIENRAIYLASKKEALNLASFSYIPALNDSVAQVTLVLKLIESF